ncbi:MAG: M20/M25/M40 family metallo-hydrolase [candidate division KSB1 bacterium]|nr:M20/M25/M40 family metallo-hydrolase [candidate division KSB1 bacterium]MDZ7274642.1 M20/M25/M40 family metallo-hydrolase [candidate division KSB1 bacterium]MDZ7285467.1 M20/M25/M40 family metallo-hydrolase [candidate division KSB1 bacterium]MDZ7298499.1 M20/M25/M40 family metallo-hydrolase [candidate division KSB1 bacterium]MDZ7306277.1 M20/M25/M40 family metallo-hydrolase [candidate division KSB1 bacterium]
MSFIGAQAGDLRDLFLHLAGIPGVSLSERRIADEVTALLQAAGVRVREDDAGGRLQGNAGNLLCFPPDFHENSPTLLLSAHLDTVQSTAELQPVVTAREIRSRGDSILGADNRLGLAVLVHLLRTTASGNVPHQNFMVAFTVAEELGMLGAAQLDLSPYHISGGFVFDCSKRPGIYIREAAGSTVFKMTFLGKAAHAGVAPEEGINAISLACRALAGVASGRIEDDLVLNLGRINGGSATNVVPDRVTVEGEIRSFSAERLRRHLASLRQTCEQALPHPQALPFESQTDFAPYVLTPEAPVVQHLERALKKVQLTPQPIRYMGGSDANVWNAKGIPAVNLGIGAQKPHSFEEFVLLEDLFKTAEIAFALVT